MALSTDGILLSTAHMVGKIHNTFPCTHLDLGSGHGDLITLLRHKHEITSFACDYTDELMDLKDVPVNIVDLNVEKIPFSDGYFDLVTCTEVIEHLEHYRESIREMYRVLKPGGTLVITTPNILNLKSRVRFLFFGFYNLFGPLHFRQSELHSTGGHINPVSLFYLIHSLIDAGFSHIEVVIDKRQKSSAFWLPILYIPIKIFSFFLKRKEATKHKTIDRHNEGYVTMLNTIDILLGRTIIVGCKKNNADDVH
jgi:SAM-dependent methyltransferase